MINYIFYLSVGYLCAFCSSACEHCSKNQLQSSSLPEKGAGRDIELAIYTDVGVGLAEALSSGCAEFILVF